MRITRYGIATAIWLLASPAAAQQPNTPPPQTGENPAPSVQSSGGTVDFGFRGTIYGSNSDEARYQRYRDLRNGPFVDGFRWQKDNGRTYLEVRADHVGYRDQQYFANYNRYGKLKASFAWNQIPLWFSQDTQTPYTQVSPGVLRLGQPNPFDLRLKRSIADARIDYSATENLDLSFSWKNTWKSGQQPWAGTFGFGDAVELPVPVDTRTTDVGAAAEWTNPRGELRVGYDGSFFRNDVSTLVWDNPQRSTDSPTAGPAQGRMMLWPDSNLNAGSLSGLVKLPKDSQATAYVSLGNVTQNEPLIPFTINSALPQIALDRPTADAKARITATAFSFNTRPTGTVWLNARFRSYDWNNQTPIFNVSQTVSYDTSVAAFAEGGTSPYSFNRHALDLEASWTPRTFAAFRAGYSRETMDQTFRTFDNTTDDIARLSADLTSIRWLTLRGVYEHWNRVGSGLDEQALDDIGEQTSLRQFDISNRRVDRVSTVVMVMPASSFAVDGTAFVGREDRPGTVFGLRSNDSAGGSLGFDYVPRDAISLGATYTYEHYTALQASRQANPGPQFNDPTRDWTTDSADTAHTIEASADLLKLWRKTDVRFAYDLSRARSLYVYGLAPNTTLPPVSQLPPVLNTRNRFTADARYTLTRHLGAGLMWWFEKYTVDDFAFNPSTLNTISQPSFLSMMYVYRPYTANTIWARVTYLW